MKQRDNLVGNILGFLLALWLIGVFCLTTTLFVAVFYWLYQAVR